ncbi:SURF1 family protein [Enterovirga sp. CN4-39]|uniref:SURF1 family protein n=1 Tax=Enterovirga sp. CN4-39 TaxID=3400910 RepID=UPI003C067576
MSTFARAAGWRGLVAPAIATAIALAILVTLGYWQLERKAWKEDLLAAINSRAFGAAVAAPAERDWPSWSPAQDEFRRVRLTGTFLHDREIQLHGLAEERRGQPLQGFYVFTPLQRPDGSIVMVNRGFVPTALRKPESRAEAQPAGEVSVTGLLRNPEQRGWFVPANNPQRDQWFVRSIGEMAQARGLGRVAPFYVDADNTPNPGGWPRGGQTRINLPNDHLHYALTWFGLALTLIGVFVAFAWRRLHPAPSRDELQPQDARHDQADAEEPEHGRRVAE